MPFAGRVERFVHRSIVLTATGLAAVTLSACDSNGSGAAGENPRQVTVVGSGQVQGKPDTLTADVGVEFVAPDVTTAMNRTNERQQAIIAALAGAGVDRNDIKTTQVSLQPRYGGSEAGAAPAIVGYRASNSIRVVIRQLESASRLLAVIVDAGGDATRINWVSYSIENDSQLVRDARARAVQDAKSRAEQYAQLSGLTLGTVISISENADALPPTPMPRAAMVDVPVEPGQQTVSFSVTAIWELR